MVFAELRYAVRNLTRAPRFTLTCIFTLALAFAGIATLVNIVEAFVFRRLAVAAPDRLIGVYPAAGESSVGFSPQALQALSDRQQMLAGLCGVTAGYGTLSVQFDNGAARQRPVEAVSGNCYELLGVSASRGRLIASADSPLAGEPARVVVISDRIWRQELAASTDVLGRTLRLEGTPLTIVGVLPPMYRGLNADEAPDIAIPIALPWTLKLQPPLAMHAVGRVRDGINVDEAAAHLSAIWPEVFSSSTTSNLAAAPALRTIPLANGFSVLRERYRRPLYALVGLAGCLLLLAAVNIGGLSLARLLDRQAAFAVQLALGAGRARLAVQLLFEALLIAAAATLLALPIARWSAQWASQLLWTGYRPFTQELTPLTTAMAIMTVLATVATLVVATPGWIALLVHDWDLNARMTRSGVRSGQRRSVIAAQIALCFVLAFSAALFTRNLYTLRQLPLGYESDRLHWARLDSVARTALTPTIGYADTVLSELTRVPGVQVAAMSQGGFGTTGQLRDSVSVSSSGVNHVDAISDRVSPDLFRTAAIPLQQGRDFTWDDVRNRAAVAIVNRSLANALFPTGDAVGETIRYGRIAQVATLVGIVADASPGDPRIQNVPQLYLPLGANPPPAPVLLLRVTTGSVTPASLREIIEPLGRHEVVRVTAIGDQIDRFLVQERLITSAALLFAALAGVVCIAGLYASLSQNITRRLREIGIRIAVGATPTAVRAIVFAEVAWTLLVGLAVGITAALAGAQVARSLLSTAIDTTTLLVITAVAIAGVAVLVSVWPAQRAARTQVATALRAE